MRGYFSTDAEPPWGGVDVPLPRRSRHNDTRFGSDPSLAINTLPAPKYTTMCYRKDSTVSKANEGSEPKRVSLVPGAAEEAARQRHPGVPLSVEK